LHSGGSQSRGHGLSRRKGFAVDLRQKKDQPWLRGGRAQRRRKDPLYGLAKPAFESRQKDRRGVPQHPSARVRRHERESYDRVRVSIRRIEGIRPQSEEYP